MIYKYKPPGWRDKLNSELFQKALSSTELRDLINHAQKDYVPWDKFKHLKKIEGFTSEEAWAYLKFTRLSNVELTPIKSLDSKRFSYNITKSMYQKLSEIDSKASGYLLAKLNKPSPKQKNQLIMSSISEEAIASSQIEGANTSRKVAKEMILTKRDPKTSDEQMIINNYQVMQRLNDWKDLNLSIEMLIEIQKNITVNTLDNPEDSGRLRENDDQIHVVDALTGQSTFVPPIRKFIDSELGKLVAYANQDDDDENFVHPVIKAIILHFWIAYLHPFVDGNGRTARAVFYWYLLRKNYWLFQYLSVSRVIKNSRVQYGDAYLHSEYDDNDLTYFVSYNLKVVIKAINEFVSYFNKKLMEEEALKLYAEQLSQFNERQVALLNYFNEHPDKVTDVSTHQSKHLIVQQTASSDLTLLVKKGLLTRMKNDKKYVYVPNTSEIKKIFEIEKRRQYTPEI